MAEEAGDRIAMYGFTPNQWKNLPEHVQTHVMQLNASLAESHHAGHRAEFNATEAQIWASAQSVIKLLMALNAGAIVAILAFLGSMIQSSSDLWLLPLQLSLGSFAAGTITAVGAAFAAFFTGSAQAEAIKARTLHMEHPFVVHTEATTAQYNRADKIRSAGITAALLSCGFAIAGGALFLHFAGHELAAEKRPSLPNAGSGLSAPSRPLQTPARPDAASPVSSGPVGRPSAAR